MKKLLIVVDMQNDFVTGALGSLQAETILPKVQAKIKEYRKNNDIIWFTRDTHESDYLNTQEGKYLPVAHCVKGTSGHSIVSQLDTNGCEIIDKPNFGSLVLAERVAQLNPAEIDLCGLCTDICVVSNALILKARIPETTVTVDGSCCAGVSEESHNAAISVMKTCQVNVI